MYDRYPDFDRDYDYDEQQRRFGSGMQDRGPYGRSDRERFYGGGPGNYGQGYGYGNQRPYGQGGNWGRQGQGQGNYGRGYGQDDYNQSYNQRPYGNQGQSQGMNDWYFMEYYFIPGPHTGKGPQNYQRSDDMIRDDIHNRLTQHGQLDASNVELNVKNGEVTLTGTVEDRQSKRMAEDIAESVTGVKDVHNQLHVQQRQTSGQQTGQQSSQQSGQQTGQRQAVGQGAN